MDEEGPFLAADGERRLQPRWCSARTRSIPSASASPGTRRTPQIAQEAFLSAYRNLGSYRGGLFRSWLFRIASNCSYDLLRHRQRRPAASLDHPAGDDDGGRPALDLPDPGPGPEEAALRRELEAVIQEGLLTLPEEQRLAVVLCDLYGFDYAAIAAATEVGWAP